MLRNLWNKLVGRETAAAEKRETELEQMSPAERHFATEGVDAIAADEVVSERLGGVESDALLGENDSPSS
jgi:hypothetical protein